MSSAVDFISSVIVDTASGPVELSTGIGPLAVNLYDGGNPYQNLVDEFNRGPEQPVEESTDSVIAGPGAASPGTLTSVTLSDGTVVYLAPGAPDWVNADALARIAADSMGPGGAVGPVGPVGPTQPPPSAPSGGIIPTVAGGLGAAAGAVVGIAGRVAQAAGNAIASAGADIKNIGNGILAVVGGTIDSLLPTISELAVGLTSRFADLAAFVGAKVVELPEYALTMASTAASAMGAVLEDAWMWLYAAFARIVALMSRPLEGLRRELLATMMEPL